MMNTSSPSTTNTAVLQTPQIIRINYPRPLIDRKPDDEPSVHPASRIVITGAQSSSSTSATVPQIVSILNPASSVNGGTITNAKKCNFHRQCLHIQSPQSQHQVGAQQAVSQLIQHHQIQLPLQTPPQLLHTPQILQQQIRISNSQIPTSNNSTSAVIAGAGTVVNRAAAQANRDAISTNLTPPMNAALLQDRYLLLDLVDGSSFYKCIDIQTQKVLVCKVSLINDSFAYVSSSSA